jgi:hypothetical protein
VLLAGPELSEGRLLSGLDCSNTTTTKKKMIEKKYFRCTETGEISRITVHGHEW